MKKAFTLLEVVISITIFMILIVFLYGTLDQTKHSNKLFDKREESIKDINKINDIFLEDIGEAVSIKAISYDNEKNARLQFKSNNTYHNAFNVNITYMISSNDKLVRIESKDKFLFGDTPYEFYDNAFIDILFEDIEFFEVKQRDKEYVFVIKQKNKKRIIFKTFKMI